jgi:putative acetyltransferase
MQDKFDIKAYHDKYRSQILTVWERSVLATHGFLTRKDFLEIKELVQSIDFNLFQVYCLTKKDLVVGFLGVADNKIEMLFMDPGYFGKGLGKTLITFAINELAADKVDVNEQNLDAVKFYRHLGFETIERTDQDDQGRSYPLLRMKLNGR